MPLHYQHTKSTQNRKCLLWYAPMRLKLQHNERKSKQHQVEGFICQRNGKSSTPKAQNQSQISFISKCNIKMLLICLVSFLILEILGDTTDVIPPYVKQCHEGDPILIDCFISSLHHLQPYLASGIKEIELPSVEPFRMDELTLSLTTGPNGYKVTLSEIDIYGASNFTINNLKLSEDGKPFEATLFIPELRISSQYASSGVLIILPASGKGTFYGRFKDITAQLKGTVSQSIRDGKKYLHVDALSFDMAVKNINMGVKNVFRNSRILVEAMNLFLRENGQEVLHAMTPQLRNKLSSVFLSIANKLLTHIPLDVFYVPKAQTPAATK